MKQLVSVSGGADSTAMALFMWERGEDFEMLFADTGAEMPEVYWLLPRLAARVGKRLHVVSGGGFFAGLVNYGFMLPAPRVRWCTRVLKQEPMNRFAHEMGAERVCVGIRADEPRRQKNWKPREGQQEFYWPLVDAGFGKKDVSMLCEKHGLLCPVYKWRSSLSCFCCFFQRKRDWLGLLQHHPTFYEIAEEWERQSMAITRNGFKWNDRFSLAELRRADEAQVEAWPEPQGEPCLICAV